METTAKLFKNGRSQAVRLPKEFRFEGGEVKIRRVGATVVLEPIEVKPKAEEWVWLDAVSARLSEDFFDDLGKQEEPQEQPGLQRLFP